MRKRLFLLFLVCALLLVSPFSVLATQAENEPIGNGDGDDGPQPTQTIVGGPTYRNTGWLLYFVDKTYGNQVSETKVIYEYRTPSNCNYFYNKTKFGGTINYLDYSIGSPWGYGPFNSDATGNGRKLKSWLLQKTADTYNVYWVINKYFGETGAKTFSEGNNLLIVEPIFWCQMYKGMSPLGVYLCASAHGWAYEQERRGVEPYGSRAIGKYTNNIFPNCVKLEEPIYFYKKQEYNE